MNPITSEPLTGLYFVLPDNALEAGRIRGRLPSGQYLVELSFPERPAGQRFVRRTESSLMGGYLFESEGDWTESFIKIGHDLPPGRSKIATQKGN